MNDIINLLEKKNNNPDITGKRVISESEYIIRRNTLQKLKESCMSYMRLPEYHAEVIRGKIVCEDKNLTYRLAAIINCENVISRVVDRSINYCDEDDRS